MSVQAILIGQNNGGSGKLSLNERIFDWGDETGTADAEWFSKLANSVPDISWRGKTKSVTLTSAVLGTTTHLIRCIGVDQDGEGTVTFQTANCLANTTVFGTNNAQWSDSGCTARIECQNYYNAFPGKDYIKQLTKVTNLNNDRSSSNMGTTNDYVWIPSFDEVWSSSYAYAPGGDEYTSGQSRGYLYYGPGDNRIKKNGDSGSACNWWLRSRSTYNATAVGYVYNDGVARNNDYNITYYLAPAFAIQCNTNNYYLSQDDTDVTEKVADALGAAPLDSPAFTGTPTAPTQASGDDSTKIATTAFVQQELENNGGLKYQEEEQIIVNWEWGSETAEADAEWFKKLEEYIYLNGVDSSWVGKTKSVTLSTAVLGTTTHLIRCIGVDQDGENTVTFQTANCLANTTTFGSNLWSNSSCTARTQCTNYYNSFPGKASIKQVTKVTNLYNDSSSSHMGTTSDYVWLPSYDEVGLGSYTSAPGGNEYTQGCSTPYSYYSSDSNRIKYESDSVSTARGWWLRSRSTASASYVGTVYGNGTANSLSYNDTTRLAPAFVIGAADNVQPTLVRTLIQNNTDVTQDIAIALGNVADTNYTIYMTRGSTLNSSETTPEINGTIAWTYE